MFTKLKHSILQKKFNKDIVELSKNRVVSSKKIQKIGILTTEEIYLRIDIEKKINTLLDIESIKICSFRKYNKQDTESTRFFTEKAINWEGEYIDQNFNGFVNEPFDLLIGYFSENNLHLENAVLHSKATFKVGFANINPQLYELEIYENINNLDSFFNELKKYLSVLQKLKN